MKEIVIDRVRLIRLMELMYELNCEINSHSPIMIDKRVADILGTSPARIRYVCSSVNYDENKFTRQLDDMELQDIEDIVSRCYIPP